MTTTTASASPASERHFVRGKATRPGGCWTLPAASLHSGSTADYALRLAVATTSLAEIIIIDRNAYDAVLLLMAGCIDSQDGGSYTIVYMPSNNDDDDYDITVVNCCRLILVVYPTSLFYWFI